MTTPETEAMQALQELLAERQRYEGWIKALEDKRASTPEAVFTRVHTDYTLRLERVMQRLSERTEHVKSTVDSMGSRLAGLRAKETERIEARQEAELRAAVGEYSDDEWTKIRDEADLEIELMAEERKGVEAELSEMERILELTKPSKPAETSNAPTSAQAPSQPAPQANIPSTSQAVPPTPSPTTAQTAPPSQPTPRPAVFPQAAIPAMPANATASGTHPSPSDTAQTDSAPSIDDFVADWPVRQVNSAAQATAQATGQAAAQAQGDGIADVPEVDHAASPAANSQSRVSGFAPPSVAQESAPAVEPRREQEKTLKCPECGAMNYATEWYCERCGGELATF